MKLCDVCGDPVDDSVVPSETLAGGVELECFDCWSEKIEERGTLLGIGPDRAVNRGSLKDQSEVE